MDQVRQRIQNLVIAKYDHHSQWMGWADFSNHCFNRMRAVYYFFNFGDLPQFREEDEAEQRAFIQNSILPLDHSVVHQVLFEFAGSLNLEGTFESDDSEVSANLNSNGFATSWVTHTAALVYTDRGPRIVDVAFSWEPMTLEEWQRNFLPSQYIGTCAVNDPHATDAIVNYRIMKSLGQNPPLPTPRCAYDTCEPFDSSMSEENEILPVVRDDPHDWAVSTDFVTDHCGDVMDFSSNPDKVPLVRLHTTSVTCDDD